MLFCMPPAREVSPKLLPFDAGISTATPKDDASVKRALLGCVVQMQSKYRKDYNPCPSCGALKARQNTFCKDCSPLNKDAFHGFWKGEKAKDKTKRKRTQRRYTLGPCERCGKEGRDRHHVDADLNNNRPDNILILCRRCHMEVDGRMKDGKNVALQAHLDKVSSSTHCKNGHLFDEKNTYHRLDMPRGRGCRRCRADAEARRRARLRLAARLSV